MDAAQLVMRAPEMLARKGIELRTGVTVQHIDREAHPCSWPMAAPCPTPAWCWPPAPRRAPCPCRALTRRACCPALPRRRQRHCRAHGRLHRKRPPVVVIGGGFIGLEVAATARKKGAGVTVLEAAPRLLGRVLAPVLSDWYAELHRSHGVELVLGAQVAGIEADTPDGVSGVKLANGSVLPAGLVVVGIGVVANDQLARDAGLTCDRGIVVDACGRTSDPAIVAAGDCTARRLADGSPAAAGIGAERHRTGQERRRRAAGAGPPLHRHPLVLERPVRPQAADGRPVHGRRHLGRARRHGRQAASAFTTSGANDCWRWTASTPPRTTCRRASCWMRVCHPQSNRLAITEQVIRTQATLRRTGSVHSLVPARLRREG
jgi:NADPH-dependent 2,4-dienoyl-CoA reductase/sulfur reductase-like enzyme